MKTTNTGKRSLLIGNGINRLDSEQSVSWGKLLSDIKDRFNIKVDLDNEFKPFTLAFEELLHRKKGRNSFVEKLQELKKFIGENISEQLQGKAGFNVYHRKFMNLGYDDLLTTNYEYSFQKSVDENFLAFKKTKALNRLEPRYSMKRAYKVDGSKTKIWHIHGELMVSRNNSDRSKFIDEESILIGYEQYSEYLNKIQTVFKSGRGSKSNSDNSLIYRIMNNVDSPFWIDKFFTDNIDIIGQGLDFTENHLWWLINQRANYKRNNDTKELNVDNRIRYFYPKFENDGLIDLRESNFFEKAIRMRNASLKGKAMAELLSAFEVEGVEVKARAYTEFYDQVIENYLDINEKED